MLKKTKAYIYVIKFQKRDLFYIYILIIAAFKNNINIANADKIIKTIIFNSKKNKKFYDLIFKHIVYKNCLKNTNVVYYNENDNCIKFFFKSFNKIIDLNHFLDHSIYA